MWPDIKTFKPKPSAARIFEEFQPEIKAFRQLEQKAAEFFKNLSQFTLPIWAKGFLGLYLNFDVFSVFRDICTAFEFVEIIEQFNFDLDNYILNSLIFQN